MEQQKDFDTLNVNEILSEGKKLLNAQDFSVFDNLMFQLSRKYFDSKKIISSDLLRHITTQLILGGYTDIKEDNIRVSFTIQNDKYMSIDIFLDYKEMNNYYVSCMYDIERCHFRGEYSRADKTKYYTLKELYEKQF